MYMALPDLDISLRKQKGVDTKSVSTLLYLQNICLGKIFRLDQPGRHIKYGVIWCYFNKPLSLIKNGAYLSEKEKPMYNEYHGLMLGIKVIWTTKGWIILTSAKYWTSCSSSTSSHQLVSPDHP